MGGLTIAVAIVTKGRAPVVSDCLRHLAEQTRAPDILILSATEASDLSGIDQGEHIFGPAGIAAQRNRALAMLEARADIVVFLDDDFVPHQTCLDAIAALFALDEGLVGATGHVLADGINGAPIGDEAARAMLRYWPPVPAPASRRIVGLYGCNMAIRMSAARDVRFDEALPLYGWQEDVDFGARLAKHGRIIRSPAFGGVHRGVKGGRIAQRGFGYAQIANPVYLIGGRSVPAWFLLRLMARNLCANLAGAIMERLGRQNEWVDRRGRLSGNLLALNDLLRGRLSPSRAIGL